MIRPSVVVVLLLCSHLAAAQAPTRADQLVNRLKDFKSPEYHEAIESLCAIGSEAVPALIRGLRSENRNTRLGCVITLKKLRSRAALGVPSLSQALNDPDSDVRCGAAEALGRIGEPAAKAVPGLVASLKHPETLTRAKAARALANLGEFAEEALPHLRSLNAEARDPELIRAAEEAIAAIEFHAKARQAPSDPVARWDQSQVPPPIWVAVAVGAILVLTLLLLRKSSPGRPSPEQVDP